jgi:hypothetical protein
VSTSGTVCHNLAVVVVKNLRHPNGIPVGASIKQNTLSPSLFLSNLLVHIYESTVQNFLTL